MPSQEWMRGRQRVPAIKKGLLARQNIHVTGELVKGKTTNEDLRFILSSLRAFWYSHAGRTYSIMHPFSAHQNLTGGSIHFVLP